MNWDFNSVLIKLRETLQTYTSWAKIFFFGTVDSILKTISWTFTQLEYIVEVYYRESIWSQAQLMKSLAQRAKYLSYVITRPKGASGNVIVSADSTFSTTYTYTGNNVSLPKWTKLTNTNGDVTIYTTEDKIYYYNQVGNLTIPVKEGDPKTYTYLAAGVTNEEISVYSNKIDNDEVEVFIVDISGNILNTVNICGKGSNPENLFFVNDTTNYYCEINNAYDFQSIRIKFGDGITSRKLAINERVLIKYADTNGSTGNITSQNIIVKFSAPLTDITSTAVTLYVTNQEEISNGTDLETLESVRNYAPRMFTAGYRAAGNNDWITLLEEHAYIHRALVTVDSVTQANKDKVYVTAISADGSELTSTQKTEVVTYMKDIKSVTEAITWSPLQIVYLLFKLKATITNKPLSAVSGLIYTTLDDNYGILNTEFQTDVYESNYVSKIDDLDDVLHHKTDLYHLEKNQELSFNYIVSDHVIMVSKTATDDANTSNQILLHPGSTELWFERKSGTVWLTPYRIAKDTGAGVFSGEAGFVVGSSNIDYVTNKVSWSVTTLGDIPTWGVPDTNYKLYLAYRTINGTGDTINNDLNSVRLPTSGMITDMAAENYQQFNLSYF